MRCLRGEHGQALVLTLLFLTGLLGTATLVLDVGSWFRAQRELQAIADAAALAGAQALPDDTGQAAVLAAQYASRNGGPAPEISFSSALSVNDTVTVRLSRPAPGFFARVFGIDSVDVAAKAGARAGALAQARWVAPIAVDSHHPLLQCRPLPCFDQATSLDLEKTGPGAFRLINLDGSRGGTGRSILAGWIENGFADLLSLGWYYSDPGAKFNSEVQAALSVRIGSELLFPVYGAVEEDGSNFRYEVIGWVGFQLTGFDARGSSGLLFGQFTRTIWQGLEAVSGSQPDFGVRAIQLVE